MWKLGTLWFALRREIALVWAMMRDPRSPRGAKVAAVLALLYVLSPVDLVPDALPLLGWLDDGVVAVLLLRLAMQLLPPELHAALRAKVERRTAPRRA